MVWENFSDWYNTNEAAITLKNGARIEANIRYDLSFKSVVVSDRREGKETQWKKFDKV